MNGQYGGPQQGYPPSVYQQSGQQQGQQLLNGQQQQQHLQQHPQQQQGQQQQQQQHLGASIDAQSQAASAPGMGQEMNLASVLHYLQSEWRRWERDRNEWEIERAEMRARIALLEGQRRSAENLKVDLLRRVKMLEFALRQERTKTVGTTGKAGAIPPSRIVALQDEDKASIKDEKEGSGSEGSEEGNADRPKINGNGLPGHAKSTTVASKMSDTSSWKNIGGVPRDPKSRARSREYLKQCLQEISYLTSPGALNPLPSRPPISVTDPTSPHGEASHDHNDPNAHVALERPRKTLPEEPIPSTFQKPKTEPDTQTEAQPSTSSTASVSLPNGVKAESEQPTPSASSSSQHDQTPESHAMSIDTTARPPSSPAPIRDMSLPETETNGLPQMDESGQILTAIYRPESKAAWREELRAANEKAEKARAAHSKSESSDEEQLANLTLYADDEDIKAESTDLSEVVWNSKKSLKSHLDIVRTVSFAHGPGVILASGGDDNTVKVWSLEISSIMSHRPNTIETEPIITFRGHTAPITSIVMSSHLSQIFSASLDSTIRVWRLPPPNHDTYADYDPSMALQTLEGHTEAVWDVVLLPPRDSVEPGNSRRSSQGRLVSASADGSVKVWSRDEDKWELKSSFTFDGLTPTCLSLYTLDFGKVLVGMSNGLVKLWDVEEGEEVMSFGEPLEDGQVNALLSHPTLPAIISAHEDGRLRFFDAKTPSLTPTHTILAHPAPITSLSLSPLTPTAMFTASADCSVRLWDLAKKTSLQDLSGHRKKSDEGVLCVASHPELPVVASAGADGVVRLWGTT